MQVAAHRGHARAWRVLLLGAGVALLWALITLFGQASSSSAAEDDGQGHGLLGIVTSTVDHVTDAASGVVGEVGKVAQNVVKAAEPVTEPVLSAAPAPVRETVKTVVVKTVKTVKTVSKTTAAVDATVRTVADQTLTTVSKVTAATPVGPIVGTPHALDPVLPSLDDVVPDLGPVLVAEPGSETPVAPGAPVVPVAPAAGVDTVDAPAQASPAFAAAFAEAGSTLWRTAVAVTAAAVRTATPALAPPPSGGLPVDTPAPAPATGGIALAFGVLAVLAVARPRLAASFLRTSGPQDDALPGAPVYETDTSPG